MVTYYPFILYVIPYYGRREVILYGHEPKTSESPEHTRTEYHHHNKPIPMMLLLLWGAVYLVLADIMFSFYMDILLLFSMTYFLFLEYYKYTYVHLKVERGPNNIDDKAPPSRPTRLAND